MVIPWYSLCIYDTYVGHPNYWNLVYNISDSVYIWIWAGTATYIYWYVRISNLNLVYIFACRILFTFCHEMGVLGQKLSSSRHSKEYKVRYSGVSQVGVMTGEVNEFLWRIQLACMYYLKLIAWGVWRNVLLDCEKYIVWWIICRLTCLCGVTSIYDGKAYLLLEHDTFQRKMTIDQNVLVLYTSTPQL